MFCIGWNPPISDVPHRVASKRVLRRAMGIYGAPLHVLRDKVGVYAGVYADRVLVAKKYIYGDLVSCHKMAVQTAFMRKVPLVMWIGDSRAAYSFDPKEVFDKGEYNKKGLAEMVNFKIRLGKKVKE